MLFQKMLLSATVVIFSTPAFAFQNPKEEYCQQAEHLESFIERAFDSESRMGFTNQGGLFNQGVCWWHSRLQRSALYLTLFRPDLPKPTSNQVQRIIKDLMKNNRVVEIGGYRNFIDFTFDHESEIQKALNAWQIKDGLVNQAWLRGLLGTSEKTPERLFEMMSQLYEEVNLKKRITFQKLQIPGIVAHAWLVIGMTAGKDGYTLFYIDSNFPNSTLSYTYSFGETSLPLYGHLVPYTGQRNDFKDIQTAMLRYCRPKEAMKRWLPKVRALYQQQSSSGMRSMLADIIQRAEARGEFHMLLRDQTLTEAELAPEAWSRLMANSASAESRP